MQGLTAAYCVRPAIFANGWQFNGLCRLQTWFLRSLSGVGAGWMSRRWCGMYKVPGSLLLWYMLAFMLAVVGSFKTAVCLLGLANFFKTYFTINLDSLCIVQIKQNAMLGFCGRWIWEGYAHFLVNSYAHFSVNLPHSFSLTNHAHIRFI